MAIVDEQGELVANLSASDIRVRSLSLFPPPLSLPPLSPSSLSLSINLSCSLALTSFPHQQQGMRAENFTHLLLPVKQFLKTQHSWKAPVTVSLNTRLESVLYKLTWFRLHRLWIVDEDNKPVGVISLTDVLKLFNVVS